MSSRRKPFSVTPELPRRLWLEDELGRHDFLLFFSLYTPNAVFPSQLTFVASSTILMGEFLSLHAS
jgi:hypothetical protein